MHTHTNTLNSDWQLGLSQHMLIVQACQLMNSKLSEKKINLEHILSLQTEFPQNTISQKAYNTLHRYMYLYSVIQMIFFLYIYINYIIWLTSYGQITYHVHNLTRNKFVRGMTFINHVTLLPR